MHEPQPHLHRRLSQSTVRRTLPRAFAQRERDASLGPRESRRGGWRAMFRRGYESGSYLLCTVMLQRGARLECQMSRLMPSGRTRQKAGPSCSCNRRSVCIWRPRIKALASFVSCARWYERTRAPNFRTASASWGTRAIRKFWVSTTSPSFAESSIHSTSATDCERGPYMSYSVRCSAPKCDRAAPTPGGMQRSRRTTGLRDLREPLPVLLNSADLLRFERIVECHHRRWLPRLKSSKDRKHGRTATGDGESARVEAWVDRQF